ncbi:MAG: RNA polymerase sigma factor [Myxococcales bacterium]
MTEPFLRAPSQPSEETDAEALARVARGELGALGIIYDRHYLKVLAFSRRVTRDAADAEDIAQETFLTAARVAGTFDARSSCRSWLFGITARLLMHRERALGRVSRFLGRFLHHAPEPTASPLETILGHPLRDELEHALGKLTAEKRMVLLLAEVEGFGCEQIASSLGIPVGTVWTRLHHARRELRKRLERRPL